MSIICINHTSCPGQDTSPFTHKIHIQDYATHSVCPRFVCNLASAHLHPFQPTTHPYPAQPPSVTLSLCSSHCVDFFLSHSSPLQFLDMVLFSPFTSHLRSETSLPRTPVSSPALLSKSEPGIFYAYYRFHRTLIMWNLESTLTIPSPASP